jgi:ribosomal protein L37AE/L43A
VGRTRIVKTVDKSKCPHCGSEDIVYFEEEGFYWCSNCHIAWQYEEGEYDLNEQETEEKEY